ncbi:hypothetical protein [Pontibacter arcticus]|uniref:Uncharacterized protein n=1 Tax=Pontibacter arcticus TaxID=2080288 RepID=A0A364RD91_9BACT|nr:hypothetical protein [Pontibacter arcticus]RAU82215.1 hypothetical protein DP923_10490 [Pontibacter arcticus]
MKATNQNSTNAQTASTSGKEAVNQSITPNGHAPVDEKPNTVLQSWQNLRKLDNKLASQQNDDLPVD